MAITCPQSIVPPRFIGTMPSIQGHFSLVVAAVEPILKESE
jgi:hypothetical protein